MLVFKPVEESFKVAEIVVYGGYTYGLTVVSPVFRSVEGFSGLISIEGILAPLLYICDITANYIFGNIVQ